MKLPHLNVIVLVTLAVVGGAVAWHHRPLNETERRLVGTWKPSKGTAWRFSWTGKVTTPGFEGSWRIADATLLLTPEVLLGSKKSRELSGPVGSELTARLQFDGNDRVYIDGVEHHRESADDVHWKQGPTGPLFFPERSPNAPWPDKK
jgi:hypothetical protein